MSDEMDIERAMHIARLWRAGKAIGENDYTVVDALFTEVERLRTENGQLRAIVREAYPGPRSPDWYDRVDQLLAYEEAARISERIGAPKPAPAPR